MPKLRLSLACSNYDRTRALLEERVPIDGVELTYLNLSVEETFFRMLRHREFDVAEMSLSSYTLSLFRDNPPFIAIPIFPSRFFRHSCIYVHAGSGICEPKDLIGKRIGNPEYQMTAPVWIRGILSDEFGVPVSGAMYLSGGEEEPGRPEKLALSLPPIFRVEAIPATKTLSQMIASGEIDALYTARAPSTFTNGSGPVRRLFANYAEVEHAYYQKTRIFPIMHTVVIRRDVYEKHPWVAQSLFKAFLAAQREVYKDLHDSAALKLMLPWLLWHTEETEKVMGRDFWPYGLEQNEHTLSTFLRYSYEQGLSKRQLTPREIFAPESLESFKV
ncbi:MAG: ABC transporter substrate-binding protein [Acidobacteriota bacterium]|jgi:4,5-dihydroxyphthalate decarboxylase|nr:ABC transporter substrate-binding protein [Acidobacteriota bacterium]